MCLRISFALSFLKSYRLSSVIHSHTASVKISLLKKFGHRGNFIQKQEIFLHNMVCCFRHSRSVYEGRCLHTCVAVSVLMKRCVCCKDPEGFKIALCGWEVNCQNLSIQCKGLSKDIFMQVESTHCGLFSSY